MQYENANNQMTTKLKFYYAAYPLLAIGLLAMITAGIIAPSPVYLMFVRISLFSIFVGVFSVIISLIICFYDLEKSTSRKEPDKSGSDKDEFIDWAKSMLPDNNEVKK
jgi:hypothetical protein